MTVANPNIIIGQNIKALREKMGLTQEALGEYLGISRVHVSYYETGVRSIPTAHLSKIANLFCLNEFDFYEEDLENRQVNFAFAFRADELVAEDLQSISAFKKIVHNYLSMKNVAEK